MTEFEPAMSRRLFDREGRVYVQWLAVANSTFVTWDTYDLNLQLFVRADEHPGVGKGVSLVDTTGRSHAWYDVGPNGVNNHPDLWPDKE